MKYRLRKDRRNGTAFLEATTDKQCKFDYATAVKVRDDRPPYLLNFTFEERKADAILLWETTGMLALPQYLEAPLTMEGFRGLLEDVVEALEDLEGRGFSADALEYDPGHVYVRADDGRARFVYLPVTGLPAQDGPILALFSCIARNAHFVIAGDRVEADALLDYLKQRSVFSLVGLRVFLASRFGEGKVVSAVVDEAECGGRAGGASFAPGCPAPKTLLRDFVEEATGVVSFEERMGARSDACKIGDALRGEPASGVAGGHEKSDAPGADAGGFATAAGATPKTSLLSGGLRGRDANGGEGDGRTNVDSVISETADVPDGHEPHKKSEEPLFLEQAGGSKRYPLPTGVSTIGRSKKADVTLEGVVAASRLHAVVELNGGVCTIRDNDSSNGTFVNGRRLDSGEKAILAPGDELRLGDLELVVRAGQGDAA